MDDCDGCVLDKSKCAFIEMNMDLDCPCKICIIKTLCISVLDVCEQYEQLLEKCYEKRENDKHV